MRLIKAGSIELIALRVSCVKLSISCHPRSIARQNLHLIEDEEDRAQVEQLLGN